MALQKVKGTFSVFLAVAFLAMQMLSFQHMAEHGFHDHKHDGHPCQISQYFQQSHSFDSTNTPILVSTTQIYIPVVQTFIQIETGSIFSGFTQSPRAPPLSA